MQLIHKQKKEEGIFIGNQIDKGKLKNPISRYMVKKFDQAIISAVNLSKPKTVLEVGCGEGRLVELILNQFEVDFYAIDFSHQLIKELQKKDFNQVRFEQLSIYDLEPDVHSKELTICCEVLEHLEDPLLGIKKLHALQSNQYLLSVPREPVWRYLNCCRGQYLKDMGNTPGHLNHWSYNSFNKFLLENNFQIIKTFNPFPWIMTLARPV